MLFMLNIHIMMLLYGAIWPNLFPLPIMLAFSNKTEISSVSVHPGSIAIESGTPTLVYLKENRGHISFKRDN